MSGYQNRLCIFRYQSYFILLVLLFITVLAFDFLNLMELMIKNIFAIFYVIVFFIGAMQCPSKSCRNHNIFIILIGFLLLKIYIFSYSVLGGQLDSSYYLHFLNSDGGRYHIPRSVELSETKQYFDFLIDFSEFNGKLTQLIMALMLTLSRGFGFELTVFGLSLLYYVFGIFIYFLIFYHLYKLLVFIGKGSLPEYSSGLFWIIAFNPFTIYYSSMPQKEILIFLGLMFFIRFIYERKFYLLPVVLLIFLYERPYLIAFVILTFSILSNSSFWAKAVLVLLSLVIFEYSIGLERAYYILQAYQRSLVDNTADNSYLSVNWVTDFLRLLFSPFFVRGVDFSFDKNIFYSAYNFLSPFVSLLVFYSIYQYFKSWKLNFVLISLAFTYMILPSHSVLKFTLLSFMFVAFYIYLHEKNKVFNHIYLRK